MKQPETQYTSFQPIKTPLTYLPRFSEAIHAPIYIKQDDFGPISWAGTKTRKAARILQDAKQRDVQVLVMCGPAQSNSCRIMAAACAAAGLQIVLVLRGMSPKVLTPGLKILAELQVEIRWGGNVTWQELDAQAQEVANTFGTLGLKTEVVPQGCTSSLGVEAMIDAALELQEQLNSINVQSSNIVHASASGGMHAGFQAAHLLHGTPAPHSVMIVQGIYDNVPRHYASLIEQAVRKSCHHPRTKACQCAVLDWNQVGEGYERPTTRALEAGQLLARTEGLLVEPSYTGKALAALVANAEKRPGATQVFWHSGGLPAYFG